MHNYKELQIWKRSIKLAVDVYNVVSGFPSEERYSLTSQMKRAVISVASNIAEGAGRNTNGEFVHFLGMSNGSSFELTTQLTISAELGLITYESINPIINELNEIQKMLYSFMNTLKSQS